MEMKNEEMKGGDVISNLYTNEISDSQDSESSLIVLSDIENPIEFPVYSFSFKEDEHANYYELIRNLYNERDGDLAGDEILGLGGERSNDVLIDTKNNKKEKGSNRMGPNTLTVNYNSYSKPKYLNISVDLRESHARVAEWSTQFIDSECPSGCAGSIPVPSVTDFSEVNNIRNLYNEGLSGKINKIIGNLYNEGDDGLAGESSHIDNLQNEKEVGSQLSEGSLAGENSPLDEDKRSQDVLIDTNCFELIRNLYNEVSGKINKIIRNLYNEGISGKLQKSWMCGVYVGEEKGKNLVSSVMMSEENENNPLLLFINSEFKDKTFHDVNTSFTSQVILEGFKVIRVNKDFSNFIVKNFPEYRVFSSSFVNLLFTNRSKAWNINHFESNFSKNSSTELYSIGSSFNAFFNSSTCSGLGGSSSTGCQSLASQNSQSSSVTSRVSLYLANMSCFSNLINISPSSLEVDSDCNSLGNNSSEVILTGNKERRYYLSFVVDGCLIRNLYNERDWGSRGMCSSANMEGLESDVFFIFNIFRSQFEACENSFFGNLREVVSQDFFNSDSCTEKSYDIFDKDSSILEGQVSATDFIICYNMLVNLDSHCKDVRDREIFKDFGDDFKKVFASLVHLFLVDYINAGRNTNLYKGVIR